MKSMYSEKEWVDLFFMNNAGLFDIMQVWEQYYFIMEFIQENYKPSSVDGADVDCDEIP